MKEIELEKLFQSARIQAPAYNYTEAETAFVSSINNLAIKTNPSNWVKSIIYKFKNLIMIVGTLALVVSTFLFNSTLNNSDEEIQLKSEVKVDNPNPLLQNGNSDNKRKTVNLQANQIPTFFDVGSLPILPNQKITSKKMKSEQSLTNGQTVEIMGDTIRFSRWISSNTNQADLEKLKAEAEKAGISFSYKAKFKRNKLATFNYRMALSQNPRVYKYRSLKVNSKKCSLNHEIMWRSDTNGGAIDFGPSRSCGQNTAKNTSSNLSVNSDIQKSEVESKVETISAKDEENIMLNRNEQLTNVNFIVNNQTKEEDLAAMQRTALAAGIKFEYSITYRKDEIQKIYISMIIRSDSGNLYSVIDQPVRKSVSFSVPIMWRNNSSGKAMDFGTAKQIRILGGI